MKKSTRAAALALILVLLLSPAVPARAAEGAARWEMEMIRADFSVRIGLQGRGVRIAVIDSGIAPLAALPGLEAGRDYTGEGSTEDELGHGTFIAGIIGSSDPSGAFRGVAPEASLVPLRCFSSKSGELDSVVSAIYDAVDEFDCNVISLSFGQKQDAPELRAAVAYALAEGVTVVAAAGNSGGEDAYYPAAYEGVIVVNAVDRSGASALDAQHNASVDLAAPGVRVAGPTPEGSMELRSGSSFAVPFVAGAAALLLSANPALSPAQVRELLCSTAADLGQPGWDPYCGWGLLDVEAALRKALGAAPCWLSPLQEKDGGVEVLACAPGDAPVEGTLRLGLQARPLSLQPGEITPVRFEAQREAASCALWRPDPTGGEVCISNVREWPGRAEETPAFSDVPADAWFYAAVTEAAASGLMLGLPDGRFDPAGPVTRAAFVTVLHRACGSPSPGIAVPFADVPADAWYAPAVAWAVEKNLVSGVSEEYFAPDLALTREALAVILWRLGPVTGEQAEGRRAADYADASEISPWAAEALDHCVSAGLMRGVSETELAPRGTVTRATLAALLTRLADLGS